MDKRATRWAVAVALIGALALAGAAFAAPQHAEHHPEQAVQSHDETDPGQMPGMCPHTGEQMMARMHQHMAMMQQMMAEMHGQEGAGMMAGPGMMGGMMQGMMADPASIDDPEIALQRAVRLDTMIEHMKARLDRLEERSAALHQRAEELRQGS